MPRSPRRGRAKGKTTSDKRRLDRSVSYSRTPLPPSPSDCNPSVSAPTMNVKDIQSAVLGCLSDDTFINKVVFRLTESVRDAVVDTLSKSLKEAQSRIQELSGEVDKLKAEVQRVEHVAQEKVDELEQYQRRNNLRFFGVPESRDEDTDGLVLQLVKEKIGIDLPLDRLERSHRIGRPQSSGDSGQPPRPRPIIVRFRSYRDRRDVFQKKKCLKGSGLTIREDLTSRRAGILRRAVELHGPRRVWTTDGRIIWEDAGGRRRTTSTMKGLTDA